MRNLGWPTAVLAAMSAVACAPPLTHLVPVEGAKSALVVGSAGSEPVLLALALDPGGQIEISESVADGSRLFVHFLAWRLEELQLAPGPQPNAPSGVARRPVPTPLASFEGSVGAAATAWRELTQPDDAVRGLTLPALDLIRCATEGGCLAQLDDRNVACTMPCPAPTEPTPPEDPSVVAEPPIEPTPVNPPQLLPCFAGWTPRAAEGDGPMTCEPTPSPATVSCGPFEAQFRGQSTCTRIGSVCPVGDYAAPPSGTGQPVFYVRAGGVAGGDGSLGSPFATLNEAYAQVPDDSVLLLSKGTFTEQLTIRKPVTMIGACAEATVLRPDPNQQCCTPIIELFGAEGVVMRDLQFRGDVPLVHALDSTTLEVTDVLFELQSTNARGLRASRSATVTGRRLFAYGLSGEPFLADVGGRLILDQVVAETGLNALRSEGARAELHARDVVVRERPGTQMQRAILVALNGALFGEGIQIERSIAYGVEIVEGGLVEISDLRVLSSVSTAPSTHAVVLQQPGSQVILRGAMLEGSDTLFFEVYGADSALSLQDTVVRGGRRSTVGAPFGVVLAVDARVDLERVLIEDNAGTPVRLLGLAQGSLRDVVLRRNERGRELVPGAGAALFLSEAAQVVLERGLIQENLLGGVQLFGAARAQMTDVKVTAQQRLRDGVIADGVGILVQNTSRLDLVRGELGDNAGAALWLEGTSSATVSHVRMKDRRIPSGQGDVVVGNGASMTVSVLKSDGAKVEIGAARLAIEEAQFDLAAGGGPTFTVAFGGVLEANRIVLHQPIETTPTILADQGEVTARDLWSTGGPIYSVTATVTLERVRCDNGDVIVEGPMTLRASDLQVSAATANGINVGSGSKAEVRRARVLTAESRGVRLSELSHLAAEDLVIEGARIGLTAFDGAGLLLNRFRVANNELAGLVFDPSVLPERIRELRITDGEIAHQPVGLRRFEGYDFANALVRVRFEALTTPVQ